MWEPDYENPDEQLREPGQELQRAAAHRNAKCEAMKKDWDAEPGYSREEKKAKFSWKTPKPMVTPSGVHSNNHAAHLPVRHIPQLGFVSPRLTSAEASPPGRRSDFTYREEGEVQTVFLLSSPDRDGSQDVGQRKRKLWGTPTTHKEGIALVSCQNSGRNVTYSHKPPSFGEAAVTMSSGRALGQKLHQVAGKELLLRDPGLATECARLRCSRTLYGFSVAPNLPEWQLLALNATCKNWLAAEAALEKYYLPIFYGVEFIVGLLGNTAVVFGYLFCLKSWTSSNIYLFNLSISDLAFLCTLPMLMRTYAHGRWMYADVLCTVNRYVLHANLYTSILFLTFISIDRYLLMKYPFREHLLQKKEFAVLISVAIWVLVTLELLPILSVINPVTADNSTNCNDYASSGDPTYNLIYSMCLTFLGFLIPLSVMCFFYFKIVLFLRERSRQLATALPLEKPLTLVIMAVVIFSVLFTPYHILRNVRIASRLGNRAQHQCTQATISTFYIVTRPLAFLNSVINPVFYFLMGDHFREMLMSKLRHHFKSFTSFRR
ncbi:PREDICTED: succinate receptor 1 [Ceratotherium simum simum]|uniref:Succinate receptor 1 n=1 Tax=Ceratotherium simum simum TaxID=73337 RepID=A0ABM1DJU3_CERSS|nr:PREDICTED: succinate receptor 1 [Ceratotherium simum simum]